MEFKVIAPGGNEIEIINELPQPLQNNHLSFDHTTTAKAEFGKMIFRNYKGNGYEIWYSNYLIKHNTILTGRADIPVLELHIQFRNRFYNEWDGIAKHQLVPFQFNLSHTPYVHNKAKFIANKDYHTFDIHFSKPLLEKLSSSYPKLDIFMDKVAKEVPADLSIQDHFLTEDMIKEVHEMLHCSYTGNAEKFFMDGKVGNFLLMALDRLSEDLIRPPIKLSPYDIEMLYEVKRIILSDFENKLSLMQIAKMVGINDNKLKRGFKYIFGKSVFDYQLAAKMVEAKRLLRETKLEVKEIGLMLGYDHKTSFTTEFKKHYGCPPGYLRK